MLKVTIEAMFEEDIEVTLAIVSIIDEEARATKWDCLNNKARGI